MKNLKIILVVIIIIFALVLLLKKENLKIYTTNPDTGISEVYTSTSVLRLLSIEKKINHLSLKLSEQLFNGKSIVLLKITTESNKKIAYIDLQDESKDISSTDNWYSAFQGSAGAQSTLTSIVETLLQKEFQGDWVDGIKLTYNGEFRDFDHISFEDIVYWRE